MLETFKLKDKNEQGKTREQCKLKTKTPLSNSTLSVAKIEFLFSFALSFELGIDCRCDRSKVQNAPTCPL